MKQRCEICESTEVLSLDEKYRGIDIVACAGCGLVWNRNMAAEPEQVDFYKEQNRAQCSISRRYLISMLSRAAAAVEFIGNDLQAGMRHLDVGCAEGTLLALTRALGLEVLGLELDVNFSCYAREVRHLEVLPVTLADASLEPASFDLISLVHVMEHLVHPVEVLGEARSLLRDGGLLYVEVPNLQQPLPSGRHFFRPKHNFYFTENTLRAVATKAGFTSLRVGYSQRDMSLQLLAAKTQEKANIGRWRDDAAQIRAKVQGDRQRHDLLLQLLFTRKLRQERAKRHALNRYGNLLPELNEVK